ncbi:hypothetical protein NQ318_020424 [Aromia moschata]|uniref:Zinc finger CCHC domain-containing protein 4 n=1 Tax=Aromia moschata TaxID=1265417 RepID=A0AAV8YLU0_9CUCU|nr:hypothetical protein NQ318_020424 [Aromia moschata]
MSGKGNIDIIIEDLSSHPHCPHGPTILFSRTVKEGKKRFFACAACRKRKDCNFFLWEHERGKMSELKKSAWEQEIKKYLKNINHRKKFLTLHKTYILPVIKRIYCNTCSQFVSNNEKHVDHNLLKGINDHQINHPSELLPALEDAKKEAQFLFSKSSVETLVNIFRNLKMLNVICIGTPRIHEYIRNDCKDMNSILLDIDSRFHDFFGPLEYCWGKGMIVVTDPPFGGRVEPIASTLGLIINDYKAVNNVKTDLPIFWIFPYFMEPQILNSLRNFKMLDYKVDYDNHSLFQDGPKGRKYGSPVRIFTNLDPGLIRLPENGYRYCKPCNRWVAKENVHCDLCSSCPSKDGRTYVHCSICRRCVKPSWRHCYKCGRCAQVEHNCSTIVFSKECFHCREYGHKKSECPQLSQHLCKKRKISRKKKTCTVKAINKYV